MVLILFVISIACVILLLPVFLSAPLRNEYFNFVSRRLVRIRRPILVVTGDSLAAGGGLWGWRLFRNPFSAINLGRGGHTSKQIIGQVSQAVALNPDFVLVSCGLNDAYLDAGDGNSLKSSLIAMQKEVHGTASKLVICLPHVPNDEEYSARLVSMREIAKESVSDELVIDLQELFVGENGEIRDKYTTDGLHLSEAGYQEWVRALKKLMSR
ncbi:SGNH/GDSL hydrolase family protein [Thalassobacter stenotrophicus]|uniref:SGNH/GDSL hydrolase family protein n=1 Tax=Thalassobacter stenotrophicus TaxID=266809 RepID=UPI0014022919|nr:GDSL-type esterase/lipase family protein [Thalassobacter stenotrophicus]